MPSRSEAPFALFETMRWEHGQCAFLDRHTQRIQHSAQELGFCWDAGAWGRFLDVLARQAEHSGCVWRVELAADGGLSASARALPTPVTEPFAVGWAAQAIPSDEPLLRHKTTARTGYDQALRTAQEHGLLDLLHFNERGEATEFAVGNLWVEMDGELLTPPVSCGLLPGVYRAWLLATDPRCREQVLDRAQVAGARRLWLSNAVRGLVPVRLVGGEG